ncbi:hypothetical protein [Amycolatopsis kentuckyensis]|uniref:hypothetical protein n=1 Tax=Amycolatopsis kentuckyensis TaxID=218823 RepID=UPI001178AD57|nr:hypothetical protein [Amycolatopsis kentuckyensis]
MTFPGPGSGKEREATARHLLARVRLRAEASEAVGILQVWHACRRDQARADLAVTTDGQDTEARRIIAVVDDAADGRADPDARWD